MANIQGPKLTTVMGLETSMAVILYSSIFFATDLLSEKFGRREAQRAVLLGFAVSVMVVVISRVGLFYAPTSDPDTAAYALRMHEAMAALFDYTPRFVFGSLLAYLLSQSFDVWVFHRIREATGVKHLWLRKHRFHAPVPGRGHADLRPGRVVGDRRSRDRAATGRGQVRVQIPDCGDRHALHLLGPDVEAGRARARRRRALAARFFSELLMERAHAAEGAPATWAPEESCYRLPLEIRFQARTPSTPAPPDR